MCGAYAYLCVQVPMHSHVEARDHESSSIVLHLGGLNENGLHRFTFEYLVPGD